MVNLRRSGWRTKVRNVRAKAHSMVREARELSAHFRVLAGGRRTLETGRKPKSEVIVSLTSFPARIENAWLAIESVFQQTVLPRVILLVLAEEEFPGRKLPKAIVGQQRRGLTILWTDVNYRSYDKLIPALTKYPDATVITIDDDKIMPPTLVADLLNASAAHPGWIIGYRGWEIISRDGELDFGRYWQRATPLSPPDSVFIPGNGGILYPPRSLHPTVHDMETAMRLAPSSDDIWFWACAVANGTPRKCLGGDPHVSIRGQEGTPALKTVNATKDQQHFDAVIEYFDLRESLLEATADPRGTGPTTTE